MPVLLSFVLTAALATVIAATPAPTTSPTTASAVKKAAGTPPSATRALPVHPEEPVVTRHQVRVGGGVIAYTATAGRLPVLDDAGETEAEIFYVAYRADRPTRGGPRPLMFVFNGGPGAASVWLHLGGIGPRRVVMRPDGSMPPPPYRLVDNETSWLDLADLVFIDPVGTGYSRAAKPDLASRFASVGGDIDVLGRFIRLYLSRTDRWDSPLFLVGESYGTFRAAALADYLLEHGIALNGIVMVSTVMNFQTISFDNGNDLPYPLFLPAYAATAWYHGKLAPDLQADLDKTLKEAGAWAMTGYLTALAKGDRISPEERRAATDRLARLTGVDRDFIDNRNLRIDSRSFARELLRDRRQSVGVMDSRFTAPDLEPAAPSGFDPTVATIRPPFTAAFNDYIREELGYRCDLEYFTLGGGIGHWDWESKNRYADTSDNLRSAFAKNPYLKLFVAEGLFDLATPPAAADYTLEHLGLTPRLRENITVHRYRAGHMIYLDSSSIVKLKRDIARFVAGALATE
jgi:carboxypeptidase C (cathepsin A)